MESLSTILPWAQIVLAVLMTVGILLQRSEAGLGASFGADSRASFHTKRGAEKALFIGTTVCAVLFVASAIVALVIR